MSTSEQDIGVTGQDFTVTAQNVGAIVNLIPPKEGSNVWVAKQVTLASGLPPPGKGPRSRYEIDWSFGPVKIVGYVDTDTWEIGVEVSVLGISVGRVYGNLQEGIVLKIDLFVVTGSIKFYLKNGNEVWVRLDLVIKFDGEFHGDYKIFSV